MKTKHTGGCHCGAVRFEVELDPSAGTQCNCTICTKLNLVTQIVAPSAFRLLSDPAALSSYSRYPEVGARQFCKKCGVHCYSAGTLAELGGAFVSVSLNALDTIDLINVSLTYWDGRHDNWQAGPRPTRWPVNATAA